MTDDQPNRETLDFLLDFLKEAPQQQAEAAEATATRAGQLLAAGTVVIGLAAAGGSELCGLLVALAVAAYVLSAGCAFFAIKHRPLRVAQAADVLWESLWKVPIADAKHSVMEDLSDGYAENERTLKTRRAWALAVLVLTAVEALLIGIALVISLV